MLMVVSRPQAARASHSADPARSLRSSAWLIKRSWRHPHRLPAGWRSERFGDAVDGTRQQLRPIRTLSALVDSFAREGRHIAGTVAAPTSQPAVERFGHSALEVAYAMRWIELDAGRDLRAWRTISRLSQG